MGGDDTSSAKLRYTPGLDGLRAIAVLLVFVFHIPGTAFYLPTGSIGVDIFFVLSGFLITNLLLAEERAHGRIDLPKFYIRRFLRLVPALLVTVVAVAIFALTKEGSLRPDIWLDALAAGTYTSNWVYAFDGLPVLYLQHSWSLAVEEQYYLFWALVVVAILGQRFRAERVVAIALAGAALSILWRIVLLVAFDASYERVYFGLDTRLDGLLVGSAAGALRHTRHWARIKSLATHPRAETVALGTLAALVVSTRFSVPGNVPTFGVVLPAVAVATLLVTIVVVERSDTPSMLGRVLEFAPFVRLGRISYGFYLFHIPVVRVLGEQLDVGAEVRFFVALVITYALAELSYRFIEQPFLSLKKRYRPGPAVGNPQGGLGAIPGTTGSP